MISDIRRKIANELQLIREPREEVKRYLDAQNKINEYDVSAFKVMKHFLVREKTIYGNLNKL